ncbi:hypothetical protein [Streptomyces sp. NPDC059761]|uniref:hypothetical protein n=1 Tax=Streptomyces sp. NPDC059761 TaxID=3346937 RepID=UPI003660E57D
MEFDSITVRALEPDEIRALSSDDDIYVPDSDFRVPILIAARRKVDTDNDLRFGPEDSPKAAVRTIYHMETHVPFGQIYVADPKGQEMAAMGNSGTRMGMTLFIPGMDENETQERFRKAMRAEFGPGVIELWNMRTAPVRAIQWDVYEERTEWRSDGTRNGGGWAVAERILLKRGVHDGHQHHFHARQGWKIAKELHQPDETLAVDTL